MQRLTEKPPESVVAVPGSVRGASRSVAYLAIWGTWFYLLDIVPMAWQVLAILTLIAGLYVGSLRLHSITTRWQTALESLVQMCFLVIFFPSVSLWLVGLFGVLQAGLAAWLSDGLPKPHMASGTTLFSRAHLRRLWHYRELPGLWLVMRIRSRYSQMILGILWIVLLPVTMSLILALIFSSIIPRSGIGDVSFVAFYLSSLVPWTLFQDSVSKGTMALISHLGIMNQIAFPREIVVIITVLEVLVDTAFVLITMVIVNGLVGVMPSLHLLWLIPLLLIEIAFVTGLTFFLSCVSVYVRDLPQLVSIVLRILFFVTPILYPLEQLPPALHSWIQINPLTVFVTATRDAVLYVQTPGLIDMWYVAGWSAVLLYAGYRFFKATDYRLVDFT